MNIICLAANQRGERLFYNRLATPSKRLMNCPQSLSLNFVRFHSPLQVQIIANQLPILVECSWGAGPSVNSFLIGWRAIFVPPNARILREVEQQHVFLRFGAGALFQLRQSWTGASRHFTCNLNGNFSRNEKQSKSNRFFFKMENPWQIDNFLLLRNFKFLLSNQFRSSGKNFTFE